MDQEASNKLTKRILVAIVAALIVAILAGLWFVSSKVTDTANQNREDKLVAEAKESAKAAEEEASQEASQEAEETEVQEPSQSNDGEGSDDSKDYEESEGSGLPGPVDEDKRSVTEETADFGSKVDGEVDYGQQINDRLLGNTGDLEFYVGVSSTMLTSMDDAYETSKGYIVFDLDNGYTMVLENYNQTVFAIAKQDGEFSEDQVSTFQEMFDTGQEVVGSGDLEGMSVLTKSDPTDLSE